MLHGLPTTRIRTSLAAFLAMAFPCPHEDWAVLADQVGALFARPARRGPDQQRPVAVLERGVGIVGDNHVLERAEAAVLQLVHRAFEVL